MTQVRIRCGYNALVTSKRIENAIPGFLTMRFLDGFIAYYPSYIWFLIRKKGRACQHPFCVVLLVLQCIIRGN